MKTFPPFAAFLCLALTVFAQPPVPAFRAVEVDSQVGIGYGVTTADIDGDGKLDIILADKNLIAWYQNPTWKKHVITGQLTERDHVCLAAADIDGDGKAEIAVGAGWNPSDTLDSGAVFYLIPPADRTQPWEPVKLQHEPTTHRMRWIRNRQGKFDLLVKPLHGRGNKGGEGAGGKVLAYQMPADPRQPWSTEIVSDFMHLTHNFQPIDWSRAPGDDLLIAGKEGVWQFTRGADKWAARQLTDQPAGEIRDGKLPGGGRFMVTIEPMHGTTVSLYTTPASSSGLWTRQVLNDALKDGHALACGDLLGTGSDQIVVGWRAMNPRGVPGIKMFIPQDREGKQWKSVPIAGEDMACEDLTLADLNGNGRLDIIAAGRQTKNLKIYFNETGQAQP